MYLSPGGLTAGEDLEEREVKALIEGPEPEPINCITRLAAKWLEAISRYRW